MPIGQVANKRALYKQFKKRGEQFVWQYTNSDELYHYGILGMKWGIRRYRNPDGTLTAAGKKRYSEEVARAEKKDIKWAKKHQSKIMSKAQKKVSKELTSYQKELLKDPKARLSNGRLSAATINSYNAKMAELMTKSVKNISAPSGKAIQFVAKRGEIGVHMALTTQGYDVGKNFKNGLWGDGRIAYKKKKVDIA